MQRDALIIGAVCIIAIVVGGWLYLFKGENAIHGQEAGVTFTVLERGTNAQLSERKNFRIKTEEEFAQVWLSTYGDASIAIPDVDFANYHVLAVFDGERPTGGYDITVAKVMDTTNAREVVIEHIEPGTGCVTTDALTSPFEFVVVPKNDAPLARTDLVVTNDCQ